MKTTISALALIAALATSSAVAAQPSGGPDAKGNAPLKHAHTVNDGAAKHGSNSFTEGQARQHIEKSGFTNVTGLAKGDDGVWRGQAMRSGQTVDVAMDFKGNVTTAGGAPRAAARARRAAVRPAEVTSPPATATSAAPAGDTGSGTPAASGGDAQTTSGMTSGRHHMRHHHHGRHHRHARRCAHPSLNGAACSGVDKNGNGISDKEDRALGH